MEDDYKIIRRPLITEKSTIQKEMHNQLAFDVRTQNYQGKKKRLGASMGRRRHWKKAIVTLKPGQKIEFFEGV
jgi:large subunit ribosomal protein L23